MKFGIYFAFWETEWKVDYEKYIKKVAKLGFDVLEISCAPLPNLSDEKMLTLRQMAADHGVTLTAGYGPTAEQNLSSPDPAIVKNAKTFFTDILQRLEKMNIHSIGGGLNSYWPVDFSQPIDKKRDWDIGVGNVRDVAKVAQGCGVDYCLECLNRFEGYLINTAAEGVAFCQEVGLPNVKLLLDTFHMNIEEDSFYDAITTASAYLRRLHTGEANRRLPGQGRLPWPEISNGLRDIGFTGDVVMEPFVLQGGTVGREIKVWRDLSDNADEARLDQEAKKALEFSRYVIGKL
ncbi:MAG: sugar phosphate isomerase/epimerase family protein [Caldilineaceae bacterium]